jgi:hypothetical protein
MAALAAGATAYLYVVDPNQTAGNPPHLGYLPCPTYTLTGTYCPGCGGLRSAHALLHGDLATSLERNPLVLPGLVLLAVVGVVWLRRGRPPVRIDPSSRRFRWVLVGLAVFWVLRNVPGWTWLSPA